MEILMVMYDEDDPLGAKTVERPDTSGKDAPPPPVDYVVPFDAAMVDDGTGFGKKEGGGKRRKVLVGVAAVLNLIVLCVAFALVSRSLDERKLNRPITSKFL